MKVEKTPKTKAACWNCGHINPTHVLPGVRLIICSDANCGVVHPSESQDDYDVRAAQYGLNARTL